MRFVGQREPVPRSYLSAVPGPPHHDPKSLKEPAGGGTADLQQQTVPTAGHGHVRRSEHSFGEPEKLFYTIAVSPRYKEPS